MHFVSHPAEPGKTDQQTTTSTQPEEIVQQICAATEEVFSTMLELDVTMGASELEQSAPGPTEGVVSLIGLAGPWVGTGSISTSPETACRISGRFLMADVNSVDEQVLDAIAELTNMVIGNLKTCLEEKVGPMELSIPTVIFGRNFTTRTLANTNWIRIPFDSSLGSFDVHLCLAPNGKHRARHAGSRPYPAGV